MKFSSSSSVDISGKQAIFIIIGVIALAALFYFIFIRPKAQAAAPLNTPVTNPYNLTPDQLAMFNSLPNAQAKAAYVKSVQPSNAQSISQITNNLNTLGDTTTVTTPPVTTPPVTTTPAPAAPATTSSTDNSSSSSSSSSGSSGGFVLNPNNNTPLQGVGFASAYVQVPPINADGCDADGNDVNGVPC